jgi:lipopolysaccharide/colanic/teichoic acid biosynthesis glycosyltransferase
VLLGRIGLIGPRAITAAATEQYGGAIDFLAGVKPGFIGPWWLVGLGRPGDVQGELQYDLHYIRNYSIWLDLHILIQVARCLSGLRPQPTPAVATDEATQPVAERPEYGRPERLEASES